MTGGGIERVLRSASDTTGATKFAAKYRPYLAPALVSTTGSPRRVGGRIARRIAAASRQGYRRSGAAQARLREATDGPVWPSHLPLATAPASQHGPWLAAATRSTT